MEKTTLILTSLALFGWGVGSFFSKIATNKMGEKAVFWDIIIQVPIVLIFSLVYFKLKPIIEADRFGIAIALLAGIIGAVGFIAFYMLIARKDASMAVPITALYPALTAILAIIFLGEAVTLPRILGIIFAVISVVLLSL